MSRKKILTMALLCLTVGLPRMLAWEGPEMKIKMVLVWNTDGTYVAYNCSHHPEMKTDSVNITLTVGDSISVYYPLNEVRRLTFDDEGLTPVEQVAKQGVVSINQQSVIISDLKAGTTVVVYDANGRMVAKSKSANGQANVNISRLPYGVYVVRAGNVNFKFLKR